MCDICGKKAKTTTAIDDLAYCDKCRDEAEAAAENAYDVAREEGRI